MSSWRIASQATLDPLRPQCAGHTGSHVWPIKHAVTLKQPRCAMFRPLGCGSAKAGTIIDKTDVVCAPAILAEYSHDLPADEPTVSSLSRVTKRWPCLIQEIPLVPQSCALQVPRCVAAAPRRPLQDDLRTHDWTVRQTPGM